MKKLIAIIIVVAVVFLGGRFLWEKTFGAQSQNEMESLTFIRTDTSGNTVLELALYHEDGQARVRATGSMLMGGTYTSSADQLLFESAQKLVKTLDLESWSSFSRNAESAPAGTFSFNITYTDGSCVSANGQGLSAQTVEKASKAIGEWASEIITKQLGFGKHPLSNILSLF